MPEEKKEEQQQKPDIETRLKGLEAMIIRSTELGAVGAFQVMALLEELEEKGIINKEDVQKRASIAAAPAMNSIRKLADEAEKELDN